jgi:hypothetical protein
MPYKLAQQVNTSDTDPLQVLDELAALCGELRPHAVRLYEIGAPGPRLEIDVSLRYLDLANDLWVSTVRSDDPKPATVEYQQARRDAFEVATGILNN